LPLTRDVGQKTYGSDGAPGELPPSRPAREGAAIIVFGALLMRPRARVSSVLQIFNECWKGRPKLFPFSNVLTMKGARVASVLLAAVLRRRPTTATTPARLRWGVVLLARGSRGRLRNCVCGGWWGGESSGFGRRRPFLLPLPPLVARSPRLATPAPLASGRTDGPPPCARDKEGG